MRHFIVTARDWDRRVSRTFDAYRDEKQQTIRDKYRSEVSKLHSDFERRMSVIVQVLMQGAALRNVASVIDRDIEVVLTCLHRISGQQWLDRTVNGESEIAQYRSELNAALASLEKYQQVPVPGDDPAVQRLLQDGQTTRAAMRDLVHCLRCIRDLWTVGDDFSRDWFARGWSVLGASFECAMQSDGKRGEVEDLIREKIQGDLFPVALPHLSDGLRVRVVQLADDLEPFARDSDPDGEGAERWRLTWAKLGLDRELEQCATLIEAEAARLSIQSSHATSQSARPETKSDPRPDATVDRVYKPTGWTQSELLDAVVRKNIPCSESKFRAIRKKAGLKPSPSGGQGSHRRYDLPCVHALANAASENNFRHGVKIADVWRELARQSVHE